MEQLLLFPKGVSEHEFIQMVSNRLLDKFRGFEFRDMNDAVRHYHEIKGAIVNDRDKQYEEFVGRKIGIFLNGEYRDKGPIKVFVVTAVDVKLKD